MIVLVLHFIFYLYRDSDLVVTVQGPRPENVIFLVHEVFEGLISESFRGVTYDYLMPCPDCLEQVHIQESFIEV